MQLFLLILSFCFSLHLYTQQLALNVRAKSAILYNPENGAILFEKKAKEPYYPASIIKIATALFILEQKKPNLKEKLLATSEALKVVHAKKKQANPFHYPPYIIEHDGVTVGLKEGKSYSIDSLLHALLLVSGNDAANVLAEGIAGSISHFMEDLNHYLQRQGIHQTTFKNPHGLHHPAQMTTAYDMALIAGLAFQNPIFRQIVTTSKYVFDDGKVFTNTSRFLKEGKFRYEKYIGGKTGYIASAGYNLVAVAEYKGRKLIAVLLGSKNIEERYEDAIHLFESAFQEKETTRLLFSKDHECFYHKDPINKKTIKAKLHQDVTISYFPSEESEISAKLVWSQESSSISSQKVIGKLSIENASGKELTSVPLFAVHQKTQKENKKFWLLALLPIFILSKQLFKKKRKFFQS